MFAHCILRRRQLVNDLSNLSIEYPERKFHNLPGLCWKEQGSFGRGGHGGDECLEQSYNKILWNL